VIGAVLALVVFGLLIAFWAWRWDHRVQPRVHRDLERSGRDRVGL
jgi:hypothetical protein